jgi:hypothetical protein
MKTSMLPGESLSGQIALNGVSFPAGPATTAPAPVRKVLPAGRFFLDGAGEDERIG